MKTTTDDGAGLAPMDCSLYIVKTERHEDKGRIIETDYRILATSVIEAVEIVQESKRETEEVTSSVKASHITSLPGNRYKVCSANDQALAPLGRRWASERDSGLNLRKAWPTQRPQRLSSRALFAFVGSVGSPMSINVVWLCFLKSFGNECESSSVEVKHKWIKSTTEVPVI